MEYNIQKEENLSNGDQKQNVAKRRMKLRIFKSFEEAAEAEATDDAQQQPLERIKETVELILRVYGVTREQLKNRTKKLHINITRYK